MELTIQQFEQFDNCLQAIEQGQRGLKQETADVYISVLLAR